MDSGTKYGMKFQSNIKCGACIEKVSASLDEIVGKGNWEVDLTTPERWLTIKNIHTDVQVLNEKLNLLGYKVMEPAA